MAENKPKDNALGCVTILVLYGLCAAVYQGWLWLDRAGYRSHSVDTVITAQENWMPGESKSCTSIPLRREEARQAGKPNGYIFSRIACDDGPDHNVKVEFYGREAQPRLQYSSFWTCVRKEVSIPMMRRSFVNNLVECRRDSQPICSRSELWVRGPRSWITALTRVPTRTNLNA
jgi:hypothetical protein